MKFFRLLKNDIRNGFLSNGIHYLVIVIIVLVSCVDMTIKVHNAYMFDPVMPEITFADLLLYLFEGIPKFVPSQLETFIFPVKWLLLHMILLYGGLHYPYNDLHTIGVNVLPRSGSRYKWWYAKCLWLLVNQIISYTCIYVMLLIFCILSGGEVSLQLTSVYINDIMNAGSLYDSFPKEILLVTVVLTFLVTFGLSLWENVISLYLKPIFSYLVMAILLLASAYLSSPLLIGNFAMAIRCRYITENGYEMFEGCVITMIVIILALACGMLRFRRYDIMNQEQ